MDEDFDDRPDCSRRLAGCGALHGLPAAAARAQDVPGIEICTVEKTMERRTSCLQSNVDFLHKTIAKLASDHQQKLDAANRQIEGLKATVVSLQKTVDDLQAAAEESGGGSEEESRPPPAKDAPAVRKRAGDNRLCKRGASISEPQQGLSNAARAKRS